MYSGSCMCGAIRFTVPGPLAAPTACHCTKCRKHHGHYEAGTEVKTADLTIFGAEDLSWFQSSEKVRRGFCSKCGSSLFFDAIFRDWTSISMGAFDGPTGTSLAQHIFVADKGDYYELLDGVPQNEH
ncbi:MAG: GFA family protein [Pseudoruegeria sp.]